MNRYPDKFSNVLRLFSLVLVTNFALPTPAVADPVALATQPMATTTSSNVKPNVMFILDDSASMGRIYLPDWANTSTEYLSKNASYNGVYYNPAVTYTPPVFFDALGAIDATTYPSQTGETAATGADADAKPNWGNVKKDGYGIESTGTTDLDNNASFYTIVPGEYCTASDLKTCVAAASPSITHPYPAPLRWCSSAENADAATPAAGSCQAIRISGFTNLRYPKPRTATITVSTPTTTTTSVTSITIGGFQVLAYATPTSTSLNTVATAIRDGINACSATITGGCTIAGFSATVSDAVVTIRANKPGVISKPVVSSTGSMTITAGAFLAGGNNVPGSNRFNNIIPSLVSYAYPGTNSKAATRTDCAGTTCTFSEEMTNYANWRTYYRTRMQAMKTSVSRAFKALNNNYRVGFTTISNKGVTDGTTFLGNNTFELAHKNTWYKKLFAANTPSFTPLRGALSKAGRYYARRYAGQVDPIQYSCQQNFTILSTDGYWNTDNETASYGPFGLTGAEVGNLDAGTTPRPMREGQTAAPNTLADIAKYYYDTDLRTSALENCAGGVSPDFPSGNPDVCTNNVFTSSTDNNVRQHMTTFTMGLGVDGTLNFSSDYAEATSGDFYKLKNGQGSPTVNWPDPLANEDEARIDDLWHAAVNGQGTYFSAKDPDQIISGFTKALSSITAKLGAAAAAATSTLNPVAGNNYAYVASYTTVKWKGNLEARSINVNTGVVSDTANWCVENVVAGTCPTTPVADTSGSSTIYNCVTTDATAVSCTSPGVFDADASTCTTEIPSSCTGTMASRVATSTDTRTIWTANDSGTGLIPFDTAYAAAHPSYFDAAHVNGLSQWSTISSNHTGAKLLAYLRGQTGYENRTSNAIDNRLYRAREAVLGDALESQPAYVSKPAFAYPYPGYNAYRVAQSGRPGTVFMGSNDGMLHAFDADTGEERWAYVPSMVIPNMWKLASENYSTQHANYVNGSPIISDIYCTGGGCAGSWRTILVAGLNGGGRGYYALDITNPSTPVLLWEFTTSSGIGKVKDNNLGYTFGRPVITRKPDGTWVVLVTSGYDNGTDSPHPVLPLTEPVTYMANSPAGNGLGYLYVLDASTGTKLATYATSAGSSNIPSGLGQIVARNMEPAGNEVGNIYGGDLQGNLWRFNISESPALGSNPLKFAALSQPITTTPVLSLVDSKPIVYVGTGKYLEVKDLSNKAVQTLYAITDDDETSTLSDARGTNMVKQTITPNGAIREGSTNPVDLKTKRGWYIDFPDVSTGSERVNIDFKIVSGTLIVPTIVPSSTVCSPGGYGWLNYFDYRNGWPVRDNNTNVDVSVKYDSTIVGVNVIYIKGDPVVEVVTAVNPKPELGDHPPFPRKNSNFRGKRAVWRELIP